VAKAVVKARIAPGDRSSACSAIRQRAPLAAAPERGRVPILR